MASLAPLGPVYQAGTLSGNPLATAAGLAALDLLDDDLYAELARRAARLADGFRAALERRGRADHRARRRPAASACTSAPRPRSTTTPPARPTRRPTPGFFHALLDEGVALAPGAYEVAFPGLAHDDSILDEVTAAASRAASDPHLTPRLAHSAAKCAIERAIRAPRSRWPRCRAAGSRIGEASSSAGRRVPCRKPT